MNTRLLSAEAQPTTGALDQNSAVGSGAVWWTIERGLYAVLLLVALSLRVWHLGSTPLSAWETSNVWPAWLAAHAESIAAAPIPNSSLQYNLHWLTFWLGASGDGAARWVSVVSGTALVLTPWWLRHYLGRGTSLAAAFLIAVDPWLTAISRLADGASLGLVIWMAALVGLISLTKGKQIGARSTETGVSVLAGLLFVSGPMGWNGLPLLVLAAWLWRDETSIRGLRSRKNLATIMVAVLLGGTLLLTQFDALAWSTSALTVWWGQLDGRPAGALLPTVTGVYDLGWPWLRLLADAPLAALLGPVGLLLLWLDERRRRFAWLMSGWLVWGGLLWLAPGRSPLGLPVGGVGLNLLAATALSRLIAARPAAVVVREVWAVVLTVSIMLVSAAIWLAKLGSSPVFDAKLGQVAIVSGALVIAILAAYGVWAGRGAALWTAAVSVTVALALLTIRADMALLREQTRISPLGWQASQTHPEVRTLVQDVKTLSAHITGDPTEQAVLVQVAPVSGPGGETRAARPDPILGWYLRDMRRLKWVTGLEGIAAGDGGKPLPLVVTLNGETVLGEDRARYLGSDYDVEVFWLPNRLSGAGAEPTGDGSFWARLWPSLRVWWRWYVYGEIPSTPPTRAVTLWVPASGDTGR